jgi:hypothetical protein
LGANYISPKISTCAIAGYIKLSVRNRILRKMKAADMGKYSLLGVWMGRYGALQGVLHSARFLFPNNTCELRTRLHSCRLSILSALIESFITSRSLSYIYLGDEQRLTIDCELPPRHFGNPCLRATLWWNPVDSDTADLNVNSVGVDPYCICIETPSSGSLYSMISGKAA